MNEREFAPAFCGNVQQRQRHGLAPCGGVAARGARFIKAADDVAHALVDRFTPAVLLEPPLLILLHKQRQRLRRNKHGKLRTDSAGKIIAKVNEDRRARMVADFGIDSIVSAKTATADAILSYVRARKNSQKSANVETMYQLVDEKVEALEFIVKNETNYTGITLKDLKVKPNNLIACIVRKRQIIIPNGNDSIEAGDSVIVVTMEKHLEDLSDIIAQVQQDE